MLSARTRIAVRLLAVAALAGLVAGCFQPMYAERSDGTPGLRDKLMGVDLPPVDKPNGSRDARIGVEIRNALAFKMYGTATGMAPTHRLVIRLNTTRSSLMVDPATALPTSENGSLGSSTAEAISVSARSRTRPASGPYSRMIGRPGSGRAR